MLKIGLTGGIGSGKSTIANIFSLLAIPIYYSDEEAKKIMLLPETSAKIKGIFGEAAYNDNQELNKPFIANIIFSNKDKLVELNQLIHPLVAEHFNLWCKAQIAPYVIKEAAILFESEANKQCDYTIVVVSPLKNRLERVIKRDHISQKQFDAIVEKQYSDEKKIELASYTIFNNELQLLIPQVLFIHQSILEKV